MKYNNVMSISDYYLNIKGQTVFVDFMFWNVQYMYL